MSARPEFAAFQDRVQRKIEAAFWELDDVMVTLAPDAPKNVTIAWSALYRMMTPEFIDERDRKRGLRKDAD